MTCGPGPPCWSAGCDGAEKGAQLRCGCMLPTWRSTFSTAGFGEDGGTLITAGRLHASCATIWLLPFWVSPHDVWDPTPASEGENPGTRQWRLCLRRLGVGVKRSAFKKGSIPRAVAMPSHSSHSSRPSTFRAPRWGAPVLPSFCCCLRSATPWGLALFSHRSASRIFIMQPGCGPSPMVIRRDDHQPCGGEKQVGLRPLPRPQLQGCSSSGLGRRVHRVGACLHVGRRPASSSSIRGRRASSSSAEEASSSHAGESELLLPGQGAAIRPPSGRRSCRAQAAAVAGAEAAVATGDASHRSGGCIRR
jgi:hypothetical protein